jgi:hypothetical protein
MARIESKIWVCAAFVTAGQFGTLALADHKTGPSWAVVDSLNYGGTGCPGGSVKARLQSNLGKLVFSFSNFVAQSSPYLSRGEARKFCNVMVEIDHAQGYQYALIASDYWGYVTLPSRAFAMLKTSVRFTGSREVAQSNERFAGPKYSTISYSSNFAPVWSPCNGSRALNVKASLTVLSRGRSYAAIALDSAAGGAYDLIWRKCRGN